MASAQSLMGLVNQLQNMEQSLSNILIEHCLKLASLTDANVFLLIETAEGRKYAGKRHLCEAYATNNLTPIGNDVELGLESNEPRLLEKNHLNYSWQNASWQNMTENSFTHIDSSTSRGASTRKRHSRDHSATSAAKKTRSVSGVDAPSIDGTASQLVPFDAKTEAHIVDVKPEAGAVFTETEHVTGDGDSDIQEIQGDEDGTGTAGAGAVVGVGNSGGFPLIGSSSNAIQPTNSGYGGHILPDGTDMIERGESVENEFKMLLLENAKSGVVAQLHPGTEFQKTSLELKVLASFLFDCAKFLAKNCISTKDALFNVLFSALWKHFTNFEAIHLSGLRIQEGQSQRGFKAYVRAKLQRGLLTCKKMGRIERVDIIQINSS